MPWLIILLGYLLGSVPTAWFAGHLLRRQDIRRMGDGNMGAANAFRELGAATGIFVGLVDAAKGALTIVLARYAGVSQPVVMMAGGAAIFGHNFPVFLGFRGGRGESTAIGEFLVLMPYPILLAAGPAILTLIFSRNVVITSAVLFIPMVFISWLIGVPGYLIAYSIILMVIVALTHFFRVRLTPIRITVKSDKNP
ncbi:MAG: glycerol-3-phosphate acyltransferase [Dehalococcoidales bacterium]|nr:glycerol-3-phosphate acyltransferase [Dehalococcoidales bacterium]